ncbi:hypothetical protein [Natronorubrum texcoconense]|uniref:Uncharacterized protein n=1 Tax=Natronorubrum texcoconense TaxID=1095776 RepID=A0A1G9HBZ2_9EURY|nr:hypothetical protein [Natronorubrum texcoconense]SDL10234.1 hypothetical protein SAMN04515672_0184 [Natronorubrum texcoconense]
MAENPVEQKVTDAELLERVTECYENDQTVGGGGVLPETVAADLPIVESTARNRCKKLADEGDLERDWGFESRTQRLGYRPARDRTVALRAGETRETNSHAGVVEAQLAEADPETRAEIEGREIRTDGGTQATITLEAPSRDSESITSEWDALRDATTINHANTWWELTHCDTDTDTSRAYERAVSWVTNFFGVIDHDHEWVGQYSAVWDEHDTTADRLMTDGGTAGYCWDDEDCPRDDCDGDLQQQDEFNVMCLSCNDVWAHWTDETEHHLVSPDEDTVARKPRVMTDGGRGRTIDISPKRKHRVEVGPDTTPGGFFTVAHPPSAFAGPSVASFDEQQAREIYDALDEFFGDTEADS